VEESLKAPSGVQWSHESKSSVKSIFLCIVVARFAFSPEAAASAKTSLNFCRLPRPDRDLPWQRGHRDSRKPKWDSSFQRSEIARGFFGIVSSRIPHAFPYSPRELTRELLKLSFTAIL
jgi:hypothetical protein